MRTDAHRRPRPEALSGEGGLLACHDLSVDYGSGRVLNDVSLSWTHPTFTAIVGPSGSGKTTLLLALAGLDESVSGYVTMLGQHVTSLNISDRCRLRLGHVGFVFQRADLIPELTIAENIALPAQLMGWDRQRVRERVDELLDRLGLREVASSLPANVSGGQQQRGAVARAVVTRPSIVFADEPTGALDSVNGATVLRLLTEQVADAGALLIMVTHDQSIAATAERQIHIRDGRVERDFATASSPEVALADPTSTAGQPSELPSRSTTRGTA